MATRPLHRPDQRRLIVFHEGEEVDLSNIPSANIDRGLVDVVVIPAPPVESLDPGMTPPTEDQCGLVDVVVVRDEHSASPGEGFDLRRIPPSDNDLVKLVMKTFKIDPDAPDARERLSWQLRRKRWKERDGRRNEDLLVFIAIERERFKAIRREGELLSDTAPAIAKRIAPYFPNITKRSLIHKVRRWLRSYRAGKLRIGG
jgi:hypothetical protein